MSSEPITIQITQKLIDAIGETIITPEKIIGESYVEGSKYIFEIKEDIIIHAGKTLKDFENIVVNPETVDVTIANEGTIDNCTIILNSIEVDITTYYSIILNCSNINNCTITLYGSSEFNNNSLTDDSITLSSIILSGSSKFYNNIGINNDIIKLSNSSKFYNNNNITGSNITLSDSSEFYNCGEISNSYIFLHTGEIFQNFYVNKSNGSVYYGTLTNTYIFAFDGCEIQNTYNDKSGTFVDSIILKFSDDCTIDENINKENIYNVLNITKMKDLNNKIDYLTKNTIGDSYTDSDSLVTKISNLTKNTIGDSYTDSQNLDSRISELKTKTIGDNYNDSVNLATKINGLDDRVDELESTTDGLKVNEITSQISSLSNDIDELVKKIQQLFSNLLPDISEQLLNKSSDSIQKLLLLLLLNKSDNDLTSNIKRLLKQ